MKKSPQKPRFPRIVDASVQPIAPPPDRGRLYYDHEIPDAFFGGLPKITDKVRWVRSHLPRATRVKIGRDSAWYEADIRAYIGALFEAAS